MARSVDGKESAMMNEPGMKTADNPTRWARWIGYAASVWGAFFATQHLYWILSGRFEPEPTIHDTRSYAVLLRRLPKEVGPEQDRVS